MCRLRHLQVSVLQESNGLMAVFLQIDFAIHERPKA